MSPWIVITSDTVHHRSTASCILSGRCGTHTGTPDHCSCDLECRDFGDCCFDGPC